MNNAPTPSSSTPLACQQDPEHWFDRRHRVAALTQCLKCVARPWCAREALKWQASWGIWAGIWIEGCHRDAEPYLQTIAANDAPPIDNPEEIDRPTTIHHPAPCAPLHRPPISGTPRSTSAMVLARSSGNCEVFSANCRYTFERLVSRWLQPETIENQSPAEVFACCQVCAAMVDSLEPSLSTRRGYTIEPRRDPTTVPFHWRGSRWVLLDRDGWLTEIGQDAQTA